MSPLFVSLCVALLASSLCICDAGVQFNLTKPAPLSYASGSAAATDSSSVPSSAASSTELLFVSHLRRYHKVYTASEFDYRYSVFAANLALIDAHNAAEPRSHRLGITEHADWTADEFRQYRLGYRRPHSTDELGSSAACDASVYSHVVPSSSLDWRTSNAVSAVKNQGSMTHDMERLSETSGRHMTSLALIASAV